MILLFSDPNNPLPPPKIPGVQVSSKMTLFKCKRILDMLHTGSNKKSKGALHSESKRKSSNQNPLPTSLDDIPSSQYRPSGPSQKRSKKPQSQPSSRLKQLPLTTVSGNSGKAPAITTTTNRNDEIVANIHAPSTSRGTTGNEKQVFQVVYGRHKPYKKNKEWTYDGFVVITKDNITLHNCSGNK